jgi:two-component system, NtrC family, response regulator HydG
MEVLVVEDDRQFSSFVKNLVAGGGYNVTVVETAKAALEKIAKKKYDMVLLDVFLPDATVMQLIPLMKKLHADIRIVTMTGGDTEELEKQIRELGIVFYLSKPFSPEMLLEILRHTRRKLSSVNGGSAPCQSYAEQVL